MGFFDDLGKKVNDVGQKTIQKTKEVSETVKINTLLMDEEKKLNNTYCKIGKLFVSKYENEHDEEFDGMINSVLESQKRIMEYHSQIQDIKGVKKCEKCGAEVKQGAAFCSTCGAEMPQNQSGKQDEANDYVDVEYKDVENTATGTDLKNV